MWYQRSDSIHSFKHHTEHIHTIDRDQSLLPLLLSYASERSAHWCHHSRPCLLYQPELPVCPLSFFAAVPLFNRQVISKVHFLGFALVFYWVTRTKICPQLSDFLLGHVRSLANRRGEHSLVWIAQIPSRSSKFIFNKMGTCMVRIILRTWKEKETVW